MQRLPPRRTAKRLKILLEDLTKYVDLMDDADIDMLLSNLAKTGGLTPTEIAQLKAQQQE